MPVGLAHPHPTQNLPLHVVRFGQFTLEQFGHVHDPSEKRVPLSLWSSPAAAHA